MSTVVSSAPPSLSASGPDQVLVSFMLASVRGGSRGGAPRLTDDQERGMRGPYLFPVALRPMRAVHGTAKSGSENLNRTAISHHRPPQREVGNLDLGISLRGTEAHKSWGILSTPRSRRIQDILIPCVPCSMVPW